MVKGKSSLAPLVDQASVMGCDQNGCPDLVERAEHLHDFVCIIGIQAGGWLVGNQNGRTVYDRPRDTESLLLPARERDRISLLAPQQPHLVERCSRPARRVPVRLTCNDQREHDVLEHAPVVEQLLSLKHEAKISPKVWNCGSTHCGDVLPANQNGTVIDSLDGSYQLKKSCLAGPGMTSEEQHLSGLDGETD